MKDAKIEEKDPIKDKYIQKLGFFKKIQVKCNILKSSIKSNINLMEEFDSGISLVVSIGLYGVLGTLASTIFGMQPSMMTFLGIGSLLWLIENKFIGFIAQIFSSIKLVEIKN